LPKPYEKAQKQFNIPNKVLVMIIGGSPNPSPAICNKIARLPENLML